MIQSRFLLPIASAAALSACAPMPSPYAYGQSAYQQVSRTTTHYYTVTVVDAKGQPVPGATVVIDLKGKSSTDKTLNCSTDEAGKCSGISLQVNRDSAFTYIETYSSTAKATAEKEGYYKQTAAGYSNAGSSAGSGSSSDLKITLLKPTDFLNQTLDSGKSNQDLRASVLKFLDHIRLQSLLVDTTVELGGIGTSEFKGKNYLQVKLDSTNVFNSLKVSKYDMGKTLFDDSIRKILNPLNDHISLPKNYFGYDVIVTGKTKSFSEKYASPKKVEYRFLMPGSVVKKYKEKEISGQALLDASVQLMDDERVELKLQ